MAVLVPVVALPAECLIRRDGLWFGRIELSHKEGYSGVKKVM